MSDCPRCWHGGDLHADHCGKPPPPSDCPTCEGVGQVAVNFGLHSTGRPSIEDCPDCQNGDDR